MGQLILGFIAGGVFGIFIMCLLQINRNEGDDE